MTQDGDFKLGWTSVYKASMRYTWENFWPFCGRIVAVGALAVAFVFAFSLVATVLNAPFLAFICGLLATVAAIAMTGSIAIAWHRKLLERKHPTYLIFTDDREKLWNYFWRAVVIGIAAYLTEVVVRLILFPGASMLGLAGTFAAYWQNAPFFVTMLALFASTLVWVGLGVRLPGIAVGDRTSTGELWRMMKPYWLHVVVTYALLVLTATPAVIAGIVLFWIMSSAPMLALVILAVPAVLWFIWISLATLSMLTLYFANLKGRSDLFDPHLKVPRPGVDPAFRINVPEE